MCFPRVSVGFLRVLWYCPDIFKKHASRRIGDLKSPPDCLPESSAIHHHINEGESHAGCLPQYIQSKFTYTHHRVEYHINISVTPDACKTTILFPRSALSFLDFLDPSYLQRVLTSKTYLCCAATSYCQS